MTTFKPRKITKIAKLPANSRKMMMEAFKDPEKFCYYFLKNDKNKPFQLEWYQKEFMNCPKKFILVNSGRQIGKTEGIVKLAIYESFTIPNHLTLIVSRSQRQAGYVLQRIRNDIESSPILCRSVKQASRSEVSIDNGSKVISLPPSGPTIRGYPAHRVLIDEAGHFKEDDIFYEVIRPMIMRTGGKILMTSTPLGKLGFYWNMYNEWRKDTKDCAVFDYPSIYNGKTITSAISMEELRREEKILGPVAFSQEYLAQFIDEGTLYFTHRVIKNSTANYELDSNPSGEYDYFMGIDWGKASSQSVVTIIKMNEKKDLKVSIIKAFPNGTPYNEVVDYVKYMVELFPIKKAYADRGAGEAQIDELKSWGFRKLDGFSFTQQSKVELFSYLRQSMINNVLKIPDITKLQNQLLQFSTEISKTGKLLLHAPKGAHDDYVDSLALAVFASKKKTIKHFARGVFRKLG